LIFNTIGVSDGISNGVLMECDFHWFRDVIADSIETAVGAQWYDGLIAIPGCDKNTPGSVNCYGPT
jgi:dihydroxy-acid dehydratase